MSVATAKILIVDDQQAEWRVFNRMLSREGYLCHWAPNAAEARQMISQQYFDLVLCDIVMPGESGIDLCRHIRGTQPEMPVIFVTGISGMETAREAMEMDVYGYIVKPVDRAQMLISVANAIKRSGLEEQRRRHLRQLEEEIKRRTKELVASNEELKRKETLLKQKADELVELNSALNVLLKKKEEDRAVLEAQMIANVHKTIVPYLDKLKTCRLTDQQMDYVEMIDTGIRRIMSPFSRRLSTISQHLTPGEFQIASLIRQGSSTKEISSLLNLSENTIMTHRYNIRSKLGLKKSKKNLRAYLNSLSNQ